MQTEASNLNIDGADIARIFLSFHSSRKVVLDIAFPDGVNVQFICPPERALQAVEEFLAKYYGGHKISIWVSEPAQAKSYEVTFKEWLEKTLAHLRG
jgi:hypothetical protein